MKQRPIAPLVEALSEASADIKYLSTSGCLPLSIAPTGLPGGILNLDASISSQYVSSILLCAPYAKQDTTLVLIGKAVISQLYIDMTIALMRDFGIHVTRERDPETGALLNVYKIPRGVYTVPESGVFTIESDASSATYPLAVAAITGTSCTLTSIGSSSLQGDARFAKEVLEPMGCTVVQTATETTVTGPPIGTLKSMGEVNMEPMTDAFLTAAVVGAVATDGGLGGEGDVGKNVLRIRGIANQRVKECNRIKAMRDQLGTSRDRGHGHRLLTCIQPSLGSRRTSLRMGSSFMGGRSPVSSTVPLFTVTMTIVSRWLLPCSLLLSMAPSLRKNGASKRRGPTGGMTWRTRCDARIHVLIYTP